MIFDKVFCILCVLVSSFLQQIDAASFRGDLKHTQEIFTPTEQWAVDRIYDGLHAIDTLCRKNGIEYALTGGTLLGSYWYGGLIPWDDDADISMLEEDVRKFLRLSQELREYGFEIIPSEWGYYISPIDGIPTRKGQKYPSIDLFALKLRDGKYFSASDRAFAHWPNEYFTKKEWASITDVTFGHLILRGHTGKYAERMLTTTYGSDWKEVAAVWWDHKNERPLEKVYVRLADRAHATHSGFKK